MSYTLFKLELLSNLVPSHSSTTKQASSIARAYDNIVSRHFEVLTGAGRVTGSSARVPILQNGFQSVFDLNRKAGFNKLNIWTMMSPFIYSYWAGMMGNGPLGMFTVTFPGVFRGPVIPESVSYEAWLNIFCAVAYTHILTLAGIALITALPVPITVPWSGVLLLACPL